MQKKKPDICELVEIQRLNNDFVDFKNRKTFAELLKLLKFEKGIFTVNLPFWLDWQIKLAVKFAKTAREKVSFQPGLSIESRLMIKFLKRFETSQPKLKGRMK